MNNSPVPQRIAVSRQRTGYVPPDAEITAEPSNGGVVLTITRRRTRRLWLARDELPRVVEVLQAHMPPVTVHRAGERGQV